MLSIAAYLINHLPTPTLHMISPYHKLFESPPNYSKLVLLVVARLSLASAHTSPHKLALAPHLVSFLVIHSLKVLMCVLIQVLKGNNAASIQAFISACQFSLKDLGSLHYFSGVEVVPHPQGLLLSQRRYIDELLARTKMIDARPAVTPLATSPALTLHSGQHFIDPTEFESEVGSLQDLSLTA
uniref:Reverse transcriptase Ty1/copia-type domain-containing protein n=1 Tax=Cannabis sativa TaxID=3483 RepID=A0A803NGX9_CANSA